MAKKKILTEEQETEIKVLLENNKMLENTKKEAEKRGNKSSVKQIERAQQEVIDHINSIDPSVLDGGISSEPSSLSPMKKVVKQDNLFGDTDMSIFDILRENEEIRKEEKHETEVVKTDDITEEANQDEGLDLTPSNTTISQETTFNNVDPSLQYDVIQLPSNGQCYRNKLDRVPVAYLTAYDENIITSPNLYKDGFVFDYLLKA